MLGIDFQVDPDEIHNHRKSMIEAFTKWTQEADPAVGTTPLDSLSAEGFFSYTAPRLVKRRSNKPSKPSSATIEVLEIMGECSFHVRITLRLSLD